LKLDGSTVSANMVHDSSLILYSKPDGIETIHALNLTQSLSPNPANNLVSLKLKGYNLADEKTVIILDATGRVLMQQAFTGNQTNINIAELYQGIYLVKVISKNGITESKLIKQ
jgi:hypothetical protein